MLALYTGFEIEKIHSETGRIVYEEWEYTGDLGYKLPIEKDYVCIFINWICSNEQMKTMLIEYYNKNHRKIPIIFVADMANETKIELHQLFCDYPHEFMGVVPYSWKELYDLMDQKVLGYAKTNNINDETEVSAKKEKISKQYDMKLRRAYGQILDLENQLEGMHVSNKRAQAVCTKVTELEGLLQERDEQIVVIKEELEVASIKNNQIIDLYAKVADLDIQLDEANKKVSNMGGQLHEANRKVSNMKGQLAEANKKTCDVESKLNAVNERHIDVLEKYIRLIEQAKNLKSDLEGLEAGIFDL